MVHVEVFVVELLVTPCVMCGGDHGGRDHVMVTTCDA